MTDDDLRKRLPAHLRSLFPEELGGRAKDAVERVLDNAAEPLRTGRLGRALKISKFVASAGSRALLNKAKDVISGDDEAERAAHKSQSSVELAAQMLHTFSELRGITMKLGQMLSYLEDAMPPEARKVLVLLQRDVSPMPFETARAVLEQELGGRIEDLYASFESVPIAAASIGQVHRAKLRDGTPVAVKIQYPGIEKAMTADLENTRVLTFFQHLFFFRSDTRAIMQELNERFMDECDYRKEADYQDAYRARFEGHPWIVVPEVHRSHSARRVLTTALAEGRTFYEWLASNPSPEERARATRLFVRFYLGAFYMDGMFNCDPHPGNYLFRDDGRIVFLDYGCCRPFPRDRLDLWIGFCRSVQRDDLQAMLQIGQELGFFIEGATYDTQAYRTLWRYLYEPWLIDAPYDFRLFKPRDCFRQLFADNPNLLNTNMPAEAVFLNRIIFGLVSLLAEIGSTLNIRSVTADYFEGRDPHWPEDPGAVEAPEPFAQAITSPA